MTAGQIIEFFEMKPLAVRSFCYITSRRRRVVFAQR